MKLFNISKCIGSKTSGKLRFIYIWFSFEIYTTTPFNRLAKSKIHTMATLLKTINSIAIEFNVEYLSIANNLINFECHNVNYSNSWLLSYFNSFLLEFEWTGKNAV